MPVFSQNLGGDTKEICHQELSTVSRRKIDVPKDVFSVLSLLDDERERRGRRER